MDELFRAVTAVAQLIKAGSKDTRRCLRVVTLLAALAIAAISAAFSLIILFTIMMQR
jgi:hypothetical protein